MRGTSPPEVTVDAQLEPTLFCENKENKTKNRSGILLTVQFVCFIRLRVFQSAVHFQLLTLPNSAIALSLLDPQHLHSMAVFSDTAKRLWGLYLFTRCSRPRVLTLRAGWNRLFIKFHLPLLLFRATLYYGCSRRLPFVLKTSSGRLRGTYFDFHW